MKSVIRRYNVEHDVPMGLVIVDYLQLMSTAKNYDSMVNQVTEISRSLKALAKEFNLPVLALSQLSRAVEARGGRPRLSDLRDSGSIEQDADVVMFLHRENKEEDTFGSYDLDVLIEKHRNGPTGEIKLKFDAKKMSFTDMANGFDEFTIPNMPSFDPETF
jgi:replicative DNA helicase